MTESRQVIQVPGAPPISIRFGARPMTSQRPSEAQQVSLLLVVIMHRINCSVLLQIVSALCPVACDVIT